MLVFFFLIICLYAVHPCMIPAFNVDLFCNDEKYFGWVAVELYRRERLKDALLHSWHGMLEKLNLDNYYEEDHWYLIDEEQENPSNRVYFPEIFVNKDCTGFTVYMKIRSRCQKPLIREVYGLVGKAFETTRRIYKANPEYEVCLPLNSSFIGQVKSINLAKTAFCGSTEL